jgi:hypothetical protein
MRKKALVWLLLAAGLGGIVLVGRRLMGSSSEWQSLGDAPSPAVTNAPAAPTEPTEPARTTPSTVVGPEVDLPSTPLPEGYDPLTDPIPPDQLES